MTRKVGVIGMGNVGSTVAHYIVAMGFADDLVLIDKNEAKVKADALDFEDAMANLPFHTNITVSDYSALKDADVIVSALGNIKLQDKSILMLTIMAKINFSCRQTKINHFQVQLSIKEFRHL